MTAVQEALVAYKLQEDGPDLFGYYPCWWCGSAPHPPGWKACPLVYVSAAELSPERRRWRDTLS